MTLDRVDLTAATKPSAAYEATLADTTGSPSYDYGSATGTGTGALVLDGGDGAVFDVYAPREGYYTVTPRATGGPLELTAHGATTTASQRLYLTAGNNRVTAAPAGAAPVRLRLLDVTGAGDDTAGVRGYEAESGALSGAFKPDFGAHASGVFLRRLARQRRVQHRHTHRPGPGRGALPDGGPLRQQRAARQRPRVQHRHRLARRGHHGRPGEAPARDVQEHLGLGRLLDLGRPRRPRQGRQHGHLRQPGRLCPQPRPDRPGPGHRLTPLA
ncbi:conserved hypothetical protein [Streptomyces himastatinicus ATCC 53653]|uniref:Uncharacterized protein n=1 Tax=Streptomyces himastatinicus ATCC 53653 TaxID=457427 RepID=D9WT81_9ACTN|nr:conserved hypothetical protein [Streptomyces himastatinicus ATCC 53653]